MKKDRQERILQLIEQYDIETQEELANRLKEEGYDVTQATVSRDIRKLNISKVASSRGGQKYAVSEKGSHSEKYSKILTEAIISIQAAQNLVVAKTVPGMAMAAAAALDDMKLKEIVGSIAGDDTVLLITKTNSDAEKLIEDYKKKL